MSEGLRRRDIFLKIEPLGGYSPLAPVAGSRRYGRDAMYGMGHETGRVQPTEIAATTVNALVYREYLDDHYTTPNTAKLVEADVNEPPWYRRVPGAVLYAEPGEQLYIHVLNADNDCHSLHVHGVKYGIDSDGAWPFGVGTRRGLRSDEILPGQSWTYSFDVTEETVGVWAFHDHTHMVQANVNRGLFGALVVRNPAAPRALDVPMFLHAMQAPSIADSFESPVLHKATPMQTFEHTFTTAGVVAYHCKIHGPTMSGTVTVDPGAPAGDRTVDIHDNSFVPQAVSVRPGKKVIWTLAQNFDHIVLAPGGGALTYCLNGRAFVGNTPTIEAHSGQRLRWHVVNLDLGSVWHNFHPHSARWALPAPPAGAADVHGLSPAEGFTADTIVPAALRLPCELQDLQCDPPDDACRVRVKGDFLFHCHLEEHMMAGLAGLVRARDWVWVDPKTAWSSDLRLPLDDGRNDLDWVDLVRCGDCATGDHDHPHTHTKPHNPCCGIPEDDDDHPGHPARHHGVTAHDGTDCDPKQCPHDHAHPPGKPGGRCCGHDHGTGRCCGHDAAEPCEVCERVGGHHTHGGRHGHGAGDDGADDHGPGDATDDGHQTGPGHLHPARSAARASTTGLARDALTDAMHLPLHGPVTPTAGTPGVPAMPVMTMPGMPDARPIDVCDLADTGYWELLPVDSHVLAVHAVLMHTGQVLFFAGSGNNVPNFNAHLVRSVVWDYQEGTFYDPGCPFDVFCSSQTVLSDGKVLVAGGTDKYDDFVGSQATYLFDPQLRQWIRVDDMDAHRWYPTLVTMGDGRAVVSSGIQAPNEVFDPAIGWRPLPNTTSLPLYPHLLLLKDGHLFYTGGQLGNATVEGRAINPFTGAEQTVSGLRDKAKRDQGSSILLPPAQAQRVMVIGGGGAPSSTKRTDIIDLSSGPGGAAFHPGPDLAKARGLCNSVILPDRTVLVTGGGLHGETRADAVQLAEIYDPATNTMRSVAEATVSRLYHSIALLLPDGRVVTAGSNPDRGDDELRLELYHPPYLFRGPRPVLDSAPTEWRYGTTVEVSTPSSMTVKWAHLVRPMATTHSADTSQRLVDLPIVCRDACSLTVEVTDNPNLAPPGWYLLFVVDDCDIPSVALWVHLDRLPLAPPKIIVGSHHQMGGHEHRPQFPIPGLPPLKPPKKRATKAAAKSAEAAGKRATKSATKRGSRSANG
ncbi:galactose oxidase-like domain-containing protein [Pedococcus bigeumensis]|nr:galactose oxidase-like domain-containing protein [Pedococcus bigeumensis]